MKINQQNKNGKEVSIIYGKDNSINVNIFNNKILMEIAGSFDNNLKELEKISGSRIYFRGNSIAIKGDKYANEKVKDAIALMKITSLLFYGIVSIPIILFISFVGSILIA